MSNKNMVAACIAGIILVVAGLLNFLSYIGINTSYLTIFIIGIAFLICYLILRKKWCLYFSYFILPWSVISFSLQFFSKSYVSVGYALMVFAPAFSFFLTYATSRKRIFKYMSVICGLLLFMFFISNLSEIYSQKFLGAGLIVFASLFALFHIADCNIVPKRNIITALILYIIGTNILLRAHRIISQEIFVYIFTGILVLAGLCIIFYVLFNRDKKA